MSLEIAIDVAMEECIMEYVKRICEIAKQFATDYDVEKIYKEFCCCVAW